MDSFLTCVLNHAAAVTNGGVVDNFCIAPNTTMEFGAICVRLSELNTDPFVVAMANAAGGPLIRAHSFADRKVMQASLVFNLPRPIALALPNVLAICYVSVFNIYLQ